MFFLQKVFQLRDHANPDAEKPFLEHLEDLRICLTRVVLTLLIATTACFFFRHELMEVLRRPVEEVWRTSQKEALAPSKITMEDWEAAKKSANAAFPLKPQDRATLYQQLSDDTVQLEENVQAVLYYRAALVLEEKEDQRTFVENLEGIDDALRAKVLALLDGAPSSAEDARSKLVLMQSLKPTEGFMLSIKLAVYAGLVISFPFLLYFLLQFVLPGLHDAERRALWPAMAVGFGLFLTGVFFSYFLVLPRVLEFFYSYSTDMQIDNVWRIGYYISFATQFTLIFGLAFELPVVVMTLVKLGVLNSEMMRRTRAYAILSIFVIAAIITPTPDALTLMLLALPMVLLYEMCIWLALFLERKARKREAEEEKERMERILARRKDGPADGDVDDPPPHGPEDPDHPTPPPPADHDPYHDHDPTGESGYEHDQYHDEHHDEFHDHDPHDYHHDSAEELDGPAQVETPDHAEPRSDDEGPSDSPPDGEDRPEPSAPEDSSRQENFDFHEETDPALTEEGEQEDVSDPWPEEEEEDEDNDDKKHRNRDQD